MHNSSSEPTRRGLIRAAGLFGCAGLIRSATVREQNDSAGAVDRLLDRIVANEQAVLKILSERTPIVETYIQENVIDGASTAQTRDDYFLGRMGLVKSVHYVSFVRRQAAPPPVLETKTTSRFFILHKTVVTEQVPEHIVFLPEGFAQMAIIDAASFDRKTYSFTYIRREFLGDVRCLVFDVAPLRADDAGRFVGRIWVEDQSCFIARVNGTYTKKRDADLYFHF